jgi:hypothetical protein
MFELRLPTPSRSLSFAFGTALPAPKRTLLLRPHCNRNRDYPPSLEGGGGLNLPVTDEHAGVNLEADYTLLMLI